MTNRINGYGFADHDLNWYEDKSPEGFTAVIWPASSAHHPWRVNVSWTSTGRPELLRTKHFKTIEAARTYCLKVTNH